MFRLSVLCAALFLSVAAGAQTTEDAVCKLISDFSTARNTGDVPAMLRTYAEDAKFKSFDNPVLEGRKRIAFVWSKPPAGNTERKIVDIRFIRTDFSIVQVDSTFTGPMGSLHFMETFEVAMQAGTWQIKSHVSYHGAK